jgi:hypothetical protein
MVCFLQTCIKILPLVFHFTPNQHIGRPSADDGDLLIVVLAEQREIPPAATVRQDIPEREVEERAAGG